MSKEKDNAQYGFSPVKEEHVEAAISRCFKMLDHINDLAADIITDIIHNNPCSGAKQFLIQRPEELAVRAIEKVIADFGNTKRMPDDVH